MRYLADGQWPDWRPERYADVVSPHHDNSSIVRNNTRFYTNNASLSVMYLNESRFMQEVCQQL